MIDFWVVVVIAGIAASVALVAAFGAPSRKSVEHHIDCDADPRALNKWEIEEHIKGGILTWDPTKMKLYFSESQRGDRCVVGNDLRKEIRSQPVLNANVLDYLFAHPELIPEEWKKDECGYIRYIFFWGTIYRYSNGSLYVRFLYWDEGEWHWDFQWLVLGYGVYCHSAVRAS